MEGNSRTLKRLSVGKFTTFFHANVIQFDMARKIVQKTTQRIHGGSKTKPHGSMAYSNPHNMVGNLIEEFKKDHY
jgi:hypothetical protein